MIQGTLNSEHCGTTHSPYTSWILLGLHLYWNVLSTKTAADSSLPYDLSSVGPQIVLIYAWQLNYFYLHIMGWKIPMMHNDRSCWYRVIQIRGLTCWGHTMEVRFPSDFKYGVPSPLLLLFLRRAFWRSTPPVARWSMFPESRRRSVGLHWQPRPNMVSLHRNPSMNRSRAISSL